MKRKGSFHAGGVPRKRTRRAVDAADQSSTATPPSTDHPVLRRLYPQVTTLRYHLLSQLPRSSKNRRRRISQLGLSSPAQHAASASDADVELGQLLDATLVGSFPDAELEHSEHVAQERSREIETFTQQRSQAITGGTFKPGYLLQAEVGNVTRTIDLQARLSLFTS